MNCQGKMKQNDGIFPCKGLASVQRRGVWYCWVHDPEGQDKRDAAYRKRSESNKALHVRQSQEHAHG